jgi:predicted molibdopterin-dependent oxidoreductase YjgC
VTGLVTVLGSGAMSNDIIELENCDALLVIGSNTTETHPIIGLRMKEAVKKGATLIVADPRRIPLVENARLWLRHRPGTDTALINGLCHVILRDNLADMKFIDKHTENFEALAESVSRCTPGLTEEITGVPAPDIEEAARLFAAGSMGGVFYTMGITQHSSGTNNVLALANLVLLTGNFGKPSGGLNPLRGQNNVQGASDMGANPLFLPGYQRVDDEKSRNRFEELWQHPLPSVPGLTATEMTKAILQGKISGLWIMGENPALSDPNMDHVRQALDKLDFLVVQDIFLTETAEFADVVLPAASFAEKNGTFTNTERRVQRIRKAVRPPGKARDDLSIINMITSHMQFDNPPVSSHGFSNYRQGVEGDSTVTPPTAEDIFAEIGRAWPAMAGINYERLERHGLQWPCPAVDHPGTPGLFTDGFPRGRARFTPVVWKGPRELPDAEYPFVLSTGRVLYQYHTGTMSRRSPVLEGADQGPHVEINPADAERLGINDGDIVRAASRRGQITLPAMVTDRVNTGIVFIPFHYKEAAANLLTNDALDPDSKIPEAKVCAVQISRESTNIV